MKAGRRETVRRALKSLRANAGLSQLDVAERLGIPEKRYWRIENGYDEPDDEAFLNRLAKTLRVERAALPFDALAQAS